MDASIDAPERILAAHERLRADGFPILSLVGARSTLDARAWLGRWARARGRRVVPAPSLDPRLALDAYRRHAPARAPGGAVLALVGAFRAAVEGAAAIAEAEPAVPVAVPSGIDEVVACLLDPCFPQSLVAQALQGLVPVGRTERNVLGTVAQARQTPFFRGACEGLLFYMLEARGATRGLFTTNARLPNGGGGRSHEVDLLCPTARVVVEIDGVEHRARENALRDARKQRDLEGQGFSVRRFANETVIGDPVAVWRDIAAHVASRRPRDTTAA